jgi:hypothetical protein
MRQASPPAPPDSNVVVALTWVSASSGVTPSRAVGHCWFGAGNEPSTSPSNGSVRYSKLIAPSAISEAMNSSEVGPQRLSSSSKESSRST